MDGRGRCSILLVVEDHTTGIPFTVRTETYGTYRSWATAERHAEAAQELAKSLAADLTEQTREAGVPGLHLTARVSVVPCLHADLGMLLDGVRAEFEAAR